MVLHRLDHGDRVHVEVALQQHPGPKPRTLVPGRAKHEAVVQCSVDHSDLLEESFDLRGGQEHVPRSQAQAVGHVPVDQLCTQQAAININGRK